MIQLRNQQALRLNAMGTKTAQDYPVTTDYGYTGKPYSKLKPHRGQDRSTPNRTPLIIEGMTCALTGNSGSYNGMTYGFHVHGQAGTDKACQNTVNPTDLWFKGGVVVNVGVGKEWGKFFTVQVGNLFISYCHLSEVYVKVGDIIQGGNEMPIKDTDAEYSRWKKTIMQIRGRTNDNVTRQEFRNAAVGRTWLQALEILSDNPEADAQYEYGLLGRAAEKGFEPVKEQLYRKK